MQTSKHPAVPLAMTAVMAAVMAVVAPFSISIGPIPLSLCTLVIYMNAYILGWKRGTVATLVYILLGAVGMPVFNSFSGGLGPPAAISWAICPWPSSADWRWPPPPRTG